MATYDSLQYDDDDDLVALATSLDYKNTEGKVHAEFRKQALALVLFESE